jgi:hypothetical protein
MALRLSVSGIKTLKRPAALVRRSWRSVSVR